MYKPIYRRNTYIYTDGSKQADNSNASAVYIPKFLVIFSDYLSAIQSLQNIRQQINNSSIIKEIAFIITELHYNLNIITSTWIPSHIDIKGNDKVDYLAKSTCKINQIQLPISLNKNEINTQIQKIFKNKWRNEYYLSK